MLEGARPVYTIGTAAEILGVHPRTLRLYEEGGLVRPARKNHRRFYTAKDLEWISRIRYLIHEKGLNLEGLRRLLAVITYEQVAEGPPEVQARCKCLLDRTTPCWDLARRSAENGRKCYECEVYLSAGERLLTEAERAAAASFLVAR